MQHYRTTFSADPHVARALKDRAKIEGKSISAVVNELLQVALGYSESKSKPSKPYRVKPVSLGLKPGLDPAKLNELLYELQVDEG